MSTKKLSQNPHFILVTAGIVLFVVFMLQNTDIVTVNFLFWSVQLSRSILLLVVLLVGILIGYVLRRLKK
ncbi:MAG: lipopolysaccharide assembly protein LapA domain-containing protein [Gammaproteobacteria bacterium]|nr:lipopolysaccharide assembly protein LapA domain-containing protein [Gammaproteobacteria bacterium]